MIIEANIDTDGENMEIVTVTVITVGKQWTEWIKIMMLCQLLYYCNCIYSLLKKISSSSSSKLLHSTFIVSASVSIPTLEWIGKKLVGIVVKLLGGGHIWDIPHQWHWSMRRTTAVWYTTIRKRSRVYDKRKHHRISNI